MEYCTTSLNAILVQVTLEPQQQKKKVAHHRHRRRASFSVDQDDDDMDDAWDDELDDGFGDELDDGLSVRLDNALDDDKDPWSLDEVHLFVAHAVQKKSQYMAADSSSSLIGQKSGLYNFSRRDSTKGTMILKTRNLLEHVNSKHKPHESEVDLLLALGKIDIEADEPMTPRFLARASPAPPLSTLTTYRDPATRAHPVRESVARHHDLQMKNIKAQAYVQMLYQDPESKLHHGFHEAHATLMCNHFSHKKNIGSAEYKQFMCEAFPCEKGNLQTWPSRGQTGIEWNSFLKLLGDPYPRRMVFPRCQDFCRCQQ
jgi:hypothetical protein